VGEPARGARRIADIDPVEGLYVAASRDLEGRGLENIRVGDILFLEMVQNRILVHTSDSVYYLPNSLERWLRAFQTAGLTFELVDRPCIANLSNVKRMDPTWYRLYFNEKPQPGEKPCNVARSNYRIIAKKIRELK